MKTKKRLYALCAALAACSVLLASCGGAPSSPSSSGAAPSAAPSSKAASSAGASSGGGEAAVEYPQSLRIWTTGFSEVYSSMGASDYNACNALQTICQNTGTELQWEYGSSGNDWMLNFNLMLSSGDYPDIIVTDWTNITGGAKQYADEGVIIDLTDMYQTNLHNVHRALENVDSLNNVKSSDGHYYYVPEVFDRLGGGVFRGFVIRQDMLEALGEKVPETLEEYKALLGKAKEHYGSDFYPMTGTGFDDTLGIGSLLWSYGITYGFYLEGDTVCYGPLSGRFAEGMGYIHDLYAQGLIDPDYATQDRNAEKGKIMADLSMATFEYQPSAMMKAMAEQNPQFQLVGIPGLKEKAGAPSYTFDPNYISHLVLGDSYAISTACKEPEKAANFVNYIYSEEGSFISNWGEENVDFVYGEDGKPRFTDSLLASEHMVSRVFTTGSCFASLRILDAYQAILPQVSVDAIELWTKSNDASRILPTLSFTSEEQEAITDWQADLATYMAERYSGLVNGQIAVDSIPAIQQELREKMHIEEILEVYQVAYDRFIG